MKQKIFLPFFLILTVSNLLPLNSQNIHVQSCIVDNKTGKGVPYATVSFENLANNEIEKILAADQNGLFQTEVKFGAYFIHVTAVGYEKKSRLIRPAESTVNEEGVRSIHLKEITLEEQPIELSEVVVKPLVEISADEIVYNLDLDPERETSTLHEILGKVPMIGHTPDNKLFVDNPHSSFLVVRNGKVDVLFKNDAMGIDQILKTIPAKAFARVKVLLAPPEYYGKYQYVINIETDKKNILFGVIGNSSLKFNAEKGELSLDQSAIGNLEKLRFTTGASMTGTRTPVEKQFTEHLSTTGETELNQQQLKHSSDEKGGIGGSFSYDLSNQHFVTGSILVFRGRVRDKTNVDNNRFINTTEESYAIETSQKSKNRSSTGELNYQYDLPGRLRILNAAYKFSSNPILSNARSSANGNYSDANVPFSTDGETNTIEHTVQLHYFDQLSKSFRLELGTGYIFRNYYTGTDYFLPDDLAGDGYLPFNTLMETKNNIVNAYSGLTYSSKRVSGSLKLKADYLNDGKGTLMKERERDEERISHTGFNLIPEARINLSFPKSTFSRLFFTYTMQKYRPNIRMLSTYSDYSNPNLIIVGNPMLKQESVHNFRIGTSSKLLSLGINYSYSGNKILPYWYVGNNGTIVQSYRNYGKYQSIGFGPSIMYFKNPFHVYGMLYANYKNDNTGTGETSHRFNTLVTVDMGYVFKNKLRLSSIAGYSYFRNSGYRDMKMPPLALGMTANKSFFNERMEVEAHVSDILNIRQKTTTNIHANDFILLQRIEQQRIPIALSVKLQIGSFKVKPAKNTFKGAVIDDVSNE